LFGKSRQAYYKSLHYIIGEAFREELVLGLVRVVRKKSKTSRWGVRKIYMLISDDLELLSIKIGRDKLFDLLLPKYRKEGQLV
jgi:hypothetical protein